MALTTNLLSYWKFDESSGNASDSVGSITLTNTNTVAYSAGKINNGADFGSSNTNKRLETSSILGIDFSTNFTYNFWVNVTTLPGGGVTDTIFRYCNNTTTNKKGYAELQLFNNGGTQQIYLARVDTAGTDQIGGNYTLTAGTWFMLTYTWDGSNQYLYINGSSTPTLSQTSTRTGTNTTSGGVEGFYVGDDGQNSRFFNGLTDEFGLWSRVLSSAEITSLYNSGSGFQYPFPSSYTMTADVGTFVLTGNSVNLSLAYRLVAEVGSFVLTGMDVLLRFTGFTNQTKNTSTFSNSSRNTSSWSNQDKS